MTDFPLILNFIVQAAELLLMVMLLALVIGTTISLAMCVARRLRITVRIVAPQNQDG